MATTNLNSHWTQRGIGKSNSVVQTLLHRQMGFPYFSRNGDLTVSVVTRQILQNRAASEESGRHVKAVKVELKQPGRCGHKFVGQPSSWIQIGVPEKTEVSITDTRIWSRKKVGSSRNAMSKEEFYFIEPSSSSGLKCIKTLHSSASGKMKKAFVVVSRRLATEKGTTTFLALMEPGILRGFDLVKNEVTDELKLPLNISPGVTGFTEMDVFDNSRRIFIMGTGSKKLTKVIIVLDYPPWKEMGIVHVQIPIKIEMAEGVCFMLQGKLLQITTWPLLMQKVRKESIVSSFNGLPSVKYEGRLTEFPTIISRIQLNSEYCGLVTSTSVPMFYGTVGTGLKFFTFHAKPEPVFEFQSNSPDAEDPIEVLEFSDGSSKALLCTHLDGERQLIEFKTNWVDSKDEMVISAAKLNGFDFWEKLRQNARTTPSTAGERRPRRTCVNNNTTVGLCSSKIPVLGMTYCAVMDLIAVLTADEEEFQVAIYEPIKLGVIKALPPVYAWPKVKGSDDVNKKRESIGSVEFIFEPDFIFISFHYSSECKPTREVFFMRLLTELEQ